jgi:hypothetical protein
VCARAFVCAEPALVKAWVMGGGGGGGGENSLSKDHQWHARLAATWRRPRFSSREKSVPCGAKLSSSAVGALLTSCSPQVSRLSQHLLSSGDLTLAQRRKSLSRPGVLADDGTLHAKVSTFARQAHSPVGDIVHVSLHLTSPASHAPQVALCRDVGEKRANMGWREDLNKRISGLLHTNPLLDIVQSVALLEIRERPDCVGWHWHLSMLC